MEQVYLGIDIGWSNKRKTTGICVINLNNSEPVYITHVFEKEIENVLKKILTEITPDVVAIDGPLIPKLAIVNRYRYCEEVLSKGLFQKYCKPGQTNSPTGQKLHRQATKVAKKIVKSYPKVNLIEAFPTAFLAVMLPFMTVQKVLGRKKSDFFWNCCISEGVLNKLIIHSFGKFSSTIIAVALKIKNHDDRAAFICALTAKLRQSGYGIGNNQDGWILLPPYHFIQGWARKALQSNSFMISSISV